MREIITLQIGQCGNQIGKEFWQLALEEHAYHCKNGLFDESMSSFFRNVDIRYKEPIDINLNNGKNKIKTLKARALLIDMEEGPINDILKSPLNELFDISQYIMDQSGSGNNWSHGYSYYGNKHKNLILNTLQKIIETCDSLQSFFLIHSLGGGTGSGLGTYILELLNDYYPNIDRFTTGIFPSMDDDVITSPYNSLLSLKMLTEYADCVLPIENESLFNMVEKINNKNDSNINSDINSSKSFSKMNKIVANLLSNLTSSIRFEGPLNVDINEIITNFVPYPKLHFLMASLHGTYINNKYNNNNNINQLFNQVLRRDNQLITGDLKSHTILACGFLMRGNVQISDINNNINKIKSTLKMIYWNKEGFKTGLCSAMPPDQFNSLLFLSNSSCIRNTFDNMRNRFLRLYKRKAHLHHYLEFIEQDLFDIALENCHYLINEYDKLDNDHLNMECSTSLLSDSNVNNRYRVL